MRLKENLPKSNSHIDKKINSSKKIIKKEVINLNKNKKFSKSPNIKRNLSKNKERIKIIEKENQNSLHYSNGNVNNYSAEIITNKFGEKNKRTKKKGNIINMMRQKSTNYKSNNNNNINNKNKMHNNYIEKRNKNSNKLVENKRQKPVITNKNKEININNKKKELVRAQTSSNKINKTKAIKMKRASNINEINKRQNYTVVNQIKNPIKYYPSYQGNPQYVNKNYNYSYNYNYVQGNNLINPYNRNADINININPGLTNNDLIYDQMDVIKSQQQYLTEDGNLINKFKGLTRDSVSKQIYTPVIENIIQSKVNYLNKLQDNIIEYKKLLYNYKE
jgi:hypothetical protein